MIGAKELILAGFDGASIVAEHDDGAAALTALGFKATETTRLAEVQAASYPEHLTRLSEGGMPYSRALIACFAAAYIEGLLAGSRAVRAEMTEHE